MPGNTQIPEILFLPRRNPLRETWTGHMYSPQEASELSGVKEIWQASEFEPFHRGAAQSSTLPAETGKHFAVGSASNIASRQTVMVRAAVRALPQKMKPRSICSRFRAKADSREYRQEQRFAADWAKDCVGLQRQKRLAHLYANAAAQVADGTAHHAARDRHQHRSAPARVGLLRQCEMGIRSRCGGCFTHSSCATPTTGVIRTSSVVAQTRPRFITTNRKGR